MSHKMKLFVLTMLFSSINFFAQTDEVKVRTDDHGWNLDIVSNPNCVKPIKVLLIGDSHVERYYPVASKLMENSYCCSKFTTGRSLGNPKFIEFLKSALAKNKFDIIFFNNGLHEVKITPEEYGKYLPEVYKVLRKNNPKVKIFWITTTTRRVKGNLDSFDEYNDDVKERNKKVVDFCSKKKIQIIPFYEMSLEHKEYYANDGIHFNKLGVQAQAEMILNEVNNFYSPKKQK